MIHDHENTGFPTDRRTLLKMSESTFAFYLTGSRFMRHDQRPDSDWDFMVQDSPEVREFLKSCGFPNHNVLHYAGIDFGGTLTTAVWEKFEYDPLVIIQVQLCPDVARKLFVRDTIAGQTLKEFHAGIRGADRTELWEMIGRQFPVPI